MLKRFLTVCIIGVLLTALPAFAGPTPPPQIISMSVTNVGTAFVGGIGGPLTMNGVGGINVEYSTGTVTYGSGPFSLNTTLATNTSIGCIASGTFTGGAFLYKDSGGTILLSGSIAFLNLTETYNGSGRFFGDGHLTITGGTLQPLLPNITMKSKL